MSPWGVCGSPVAPESSSAYSSREAPKNANLHATRESTAALASSAILIIRAFPEKENRSEATGLRRISWEIGYARRWQPPRLLVA